MSIEIEYTESRPVSPEQLSALFKSSGIIRPVDDLERLRRMLEKANLTIAAFSGDTLVGIARSVTDFSFCCYLSDLAVAGDFQRHGIGRELVRRVRARIGPECCLILLSAPNAMEYYPKLGFQSADNAWRIKRER